jgi:hypothetical protein
VLSAKRNVRDDVEYNGHVVYVHVVCVNALTHPHVV